MLRLPALLLLVALSGAHGSAQTTGVLTGRISDSAVEDRSAGALPGVRVTVAGNTFRGEMVTDASGRFTSSALPMGDYDVTASLPGFTPVTGHLKLSAAAMTAHLEWSLRVACLHEVQTVLLPLSHAARLASVIAHVRVGADNIVAQWSTTPECGWFPARDHTVTAIRAITRSGSGPGRGDRLGVLTLPREQLEPGEYLLLLTWDPKLERYWSMGPHTVRVDAGRIARDADPELRGLPVAAALERLRAWAGQP